MDIPQISPNQRIIVPDHLIPREQQTRAALDEDAIADHLEKFLLAEDNDAQCKVFSDPLGGCHVYCFPPSQILKRNYWTLVSMGMSGTKMNVPADLVGGEEYQYAEVMCYLPADWEMPLISAANQISSNNWPVEMLRSLAAYVVSTRCWVAEDHGIPSLLTDTPGEPFHASTKLANMILLAPVDEAEGFETVNVNGNTVNFYVVVPLTPAEAQWKREVGAAKSIHYIVGNKREYPENVLVDYVIDTSRPCCVEDLQCREYFDNLEDEESEEDGDDDGDEDDDDDVDAVAEDVEDGNGGAELEMES